MDKDSRIGFIPHMHHPLLRNTTGGYRSIVSKSYILSTRKYTTCIGRKLVNRLPDLHPEYIHAIPIHASQDLIFINFHFTPTVFGKLF